MTSQTQIKAVIFDLGGVLLRTDDPRPRIELAAQLGISRSELEESIFNNSVSLLAEAGQAAPADVWTEAARLLNRPVEEMPAINKTFFSGDRVDFELIRFIQGLRPARTTALLSNSWVVDLPRHISENLHITDTFDVVVSSAKEGIRKPDAGIYQITLDRVHARPEEAVFVDDAARNITAAAALGIHTVHFRSAQQARAELTELLGLPD